MKRLSSFVKSPPFTHFILYCILFNSLMLIIETSLPLSTTYKAMLNGFSYCFMLIFILEACLKIIALRSTYFKEGWNWFDLIVTIVSSIPYISFLNSLRALRILRLVAHVPSLKRIVEALALSIPGMLSTCLLLMIIYVVFGIITTELFSAEFPVWFGNLSRSLYSLFQIMTLESWSMGIVRPVMEIFPYAWIIFIPFILLSSFILLNFIIGIIVDSISELKHSDEKDNLNHKLDHILEELEKIKKG